MVKRGQHSSKGGKANQKLKLSNGASMLAKDLVSCNQRAFCSFASKSTGLLVEMNKLPNGDNSHGFSISKYQTQLCLWNYPQVEGFLQHFSSSLLFLFLNNFDETGTMFPL